MIFIVLRDGVEFCCLKEKLQFVYSENWMFASRVRSNNNEVHFYNICFCLLCQDCHAMKHTLHDQHTVLEHEDILSHNHARSYMKPEANGKYIFCNHEFLSTTSGIYFLYKTCLQNTNTHYLRLIELSSNPALAALWESCICDYFCSAAIVGLVKSTLNMVRPSLGPTLNWSHISWTTVKTSLWAASKDHMGHLY